MRRLAVLLALASVGLGACHGPAPSELVAVTPAPLAEALLSVAGRSASDVWAVGADHGAGPIVLHLAEGAWTRVPTNTRGTLWWVHAFPDGTLYAAGAGSTILRWDGRAFTRMPTPGVASYTVFGVWGRSPDDAYAVGSVSGRDGFIWHLVDGVWTDVAVPFDLPGDTSEAPGFFKVSGNAEDVWVVGAHGNVLRSHAGGVFAPVDSTTQQTLYTTAASDSLVVAVGGGGEGVLLESAGGGPFIDVTPAGAGLIQGVSMRDDGHAIASGGDGALFERSDGHWQRLSTTIASSVQSLHATWLDPDGGLWAVGGGVLTPALDNGFMVHRGATIASYAPAPADGGVDLMPPAVCPDAQIDPQPTRSIARRWDEQLLGAIRRDLPRPVVHSRTLFHVSAAMWDAWATYDAIADGVFFHERHALTDVDAAREEAISYAAYRVLVQRYSTQIGGAVSVACFDAFMGRLGYDTSEASVTGNAPSTIGNRVAATIIAATMNDGSNEANNYEDTTGWMPTNQPLVVDQPGTQMTDPDHWQPLNLAVAETQNGIVTAAGVQGYIGSDWDLVTPFAMQRPSADVPYYDPGAAPTFAQPEMKGWVVDLIKREAALDPSEPPTFDGSPGAYGNNSLGTNDGNGRPLNPATGAPYAPQVVPRGDFGRVMAEFWADGPSSETPPGHWNVIANHVADDPSFSAKLGGVGAVLDPLQWDVKVYLALNGAVHDAGISAWGTKRRTTTVRPISLVRHMAELGQSSDPAQPHYDPNGLPLVAGLIELITADSSAPGQRHAALARHVGEVAVRAWRGEPGDRVHELGGIAWIRAMEWVPYQRRTFVTPAFPGFISGHSTFSRAAAEVLTALTGSELFPGGLGEYVVQPGSLKFELGPTTAVHLQWASYFDAADQAGQSRLWGGIHIEPDDFGGRRTGSLIGKGAAALALKYFDGSAMP